MARSRPGKFSGVLHKLPKLTSSEAPEYQDKVESTKIDIRQRFDGATDPIRVAQLYRAARAQKEELEQRVYDTNLQLEAITQLLIESQELGADGWGLYGSPDTTLRLANGDSIRVQPEPYTTTEDRDATRDWFIQSGLTRMLSVPWQTLNTYNKERLLEGEAEIPGTKIYIKTKLVYTAAKSKDAREELVTDREDI
jgi:hypothetical protein